MYENDFFYAETPVPDVKFHVWNIQIHTSIQQRQIFSHPTSGNTLINKEKRRDEVSIYITSKGKNYILSIGILFDY